MPDNFHVNCPVKETVYTEVQCLGTTQVVGQKVQQAHHRNRSLGANLTHSTESFLVREMIRRCNLDQSTRQAVAELIESGRTHRVKPTKDNSMMVVKLWKLYEQTGFLSARILQHLDNYSIKLVSKQEIKRLMGTIPNKTFAIKTVHD